MIVEAWIVMSNIALTVVTLLGSYITIVDIHREDQRTIRTILFGQHATREHRRKGKHE